MNPNDLAERIISGDEKAASRAISMIENGEETGFEVLSKLYPKTGTSFRIGVTGSPGAGKSTIIDRLAFCYGKKGKKIGVIAIDPTSIKTKGAFFGDRLRLKNAEKIEGIFIRSMAHRGFSGGISKAALGAECILEALGKEIIIVESVGVGQTELSISLISDVVITVLTPDFGDEIQLMKAGLLDIGDIIVMNKMDIPNAEEKAKDIIHYLESIKGEISVPLVKTIARQGQGVELLIDTLEQEREKKLKEEKENKEKIKTLVIALIKEEMEKGIEEMMEKNITFNDLLAQVISKKLDPYYMARLVVSNILKNGKLEETLG
ncbi:MAG: methylmalonyl Co-A mutase-associated GTPase MeaB [Deltaproteobacteria bacterium]|nr:methylmalonyl Co-A mutase-associated GTPase MeaB [Deltaproteobacteria bacterium]